MLSGGNVDLGILPGLIRRHETQAGRRLILFARISDRPGGLARLLTLFAEHGANLVEVEHVREGVDLHVRETGVQAVLEVRGRGHAESVVRAATEAGYSIDVINQSPALTQVAMTSSGIIRRVGSPPARRAVATSMCLCAARTTRRTPPNRW